MAAGVGKTYAMLEEAEDRWRGEDVVVGRLEPTAGGEIAHGGGAEVVPRCARAPWGPVRAGR